MSLVQSSTAKSNPISDQIENLLLDVACRAESVQKLADELLSRHTNTPQPIGGEANVPAPMPTWPDYYNTLRNHTLRIDRALEQIRDALSKSEI